ncbi:MAG: choice-of-anchor J domain-containing protein [Candidatus Eisenbacteria bacterium]|nr:choice-of-anchor J domain-containing protein [Candidatus Eisenbacteria bacterium]
MKQSILLVVSFVSICILLAFISGCTRKIEVSPTQPDGTLRHAYTGSITVKIRDRCTDRPVGGVLASVGANGVVVTATSDGSGSLSFANIPISASGLADSIRRSDVQVVTGRYVFTLSFVDVNQSIPGGSPRYKDYYFVDTLVTFVGLSDNLTSSIYFQVSKLNTRIAGEVVDQNMQPVNGAIVMLFDQMMRTLIADTVTVNGVYSFRNVESGINVAIRAQSSDGSLEGGLPAPGYFTLICNSTSDSLRAQVQAEQIVLSPVDNISPFVTSITPQHNSDVSPTDLQIVYTFSEPVKQTPYTRTDLPPGHGTIIDGIVFIYDGYKAPTAPAGPIPRTAQWNSSFTQLTVTPQGIIGSAKYSVDARTAFTAANILDRSGRGLVNNANITGDFEVLRLTTNGSSTVPGAPVLVRRSIPGTFDPLDVGGGTVGLAWGFDATARAYNIYRSVGGGSFDTLRTNYTKTQFQETSPVLYAGTWPDPYAARSVRYKVTGLSRDLVEGTASNIIEVSDSKKPTVVWGSFSIDSTSAAAKANGVYYMTLPFSEPLLISSAEDNPSTKYVFTNTSPALTVTKADYLGWNAGLSAWVVRLTVSPRGGLKPNGATQPTLTVGTSVTDLNGNALDTAGGANVYKFPMYFFEGFEAVWTGSGGAAPAGWTRVDVVGTGNWVQRVNPLTGQAPPLGNVAYDATATASFGSGTVAGNTVRIESPIINLSSAAAPKVRFAYVNTTGTDVLRLRISTDGGANWSTVSTLGTTPSSTWQIQTIAIPGAANQSDVKIGFEAVADAGTSDIWADYTWVYE